MHTVWCFIYLRTNLTKCHSQMGTIRWKWITYQSLVRDVKTLRKSVPNHSGYNTVEQHLHRIRRWGRSTWHIPRTCRHRCRCLDRRSQTHRDQRRYRPLSASRLFCAAGSRVFAPRCPRAWSLRTMFIKNRVWYYTGFRDGSLWSVRVSPSYEIDWPTR